MSIDAIMQALPNLDAADLSRIRDLLNSIEDQRDATQIVEMARKIDDKDPSHWITLEELEKRLSLGKYDSGE
jgi:hypothetical protein